MRPVRVMFYADPEASPKEDMMKVQDAMRGYDYDLPLKDVLNDVEESDDRRVLAGATIGVGLDTAYLAISELEEAFGTLANDVSNGVHQGEGRKDLEEILRDKNPFQMRLWYLLYDTPIDLAQSQLAWLKSLTYRRGRMAKVMRDEKLGVTYATDAAICEGITAAQVMAGVATKR
ncbi:MAG: hypothetical protein EOO77_12290 [Oxalobacteraceae bacterium]|nr:MAG: hypothetical protein EOO77_12290 [Oxalobacteraceae bacterium]